MSLLQRVGRLPRKYLSAGRVVFELRLRRPGDVRQALAWMEGRRWYRDSLEVSQAPEEILWLLELVRAENPSRVVEIGTDQGGTLFLWPYVAADEALIVAVDTRPLGPLGRVSPYALVRRSFARSRQRIELMMPANSHDPATVDRVRRSLGGRPIDVLFIDGDHSYQGVKSDYELYSPLVRRGGIIALHDVDAVGAPDVRAFWQELKASLPTEELVASHGRRYGVGVVRVA